LKRDQCGGVDDKSLGYT